MLFLTIISFLMAVNTEYYCAKLIFMAFIDGTKTYKLSNCYNIGITQLFSTGNLRKLFVYLKFRQNGIVLLIE